MDSLHAKRHEWQHRVTSPAPCPVSSKLLLCTICAVCTRQMNPGAVCKARGRGSNGLGAAVKEGAMRASVQANQRTMPPSP